MLIAGGPRSRRNPLIGYVPQKVLFDPDMPLRARDVVALGLDGHRLGLRLDLAPPGPGRGDARRGRRRPLRRQRVGNLSGGEQQRVLIAHALISRPKLLLLDEPLANLDIASGQEIVELLARIATEQQVAVLLSAHDMNPLLPVMDRIVYLAGGRAASGTTDEVVRPEVLSEPLRPSRRRAPRPRPDHRRGRGDGGPEIPIFVHGDRRAGSPDHGSCHWLVEPGFFSNGTVQTALLAVVSSASRRRWWALHRDARPVLRRRGARRHGRDGGIGRVLLNVNPLWGFVGAALSPPASSSSSAPSASTAVTSRRASSSARRWAGGAVPLLRHNALEHDRGVDHDPLRLAVRHRELDRPGRDRAAAAVLGVVLLLYRPLLLTTLSPDLRPGPGRPGAPGRRRLPASRWRSPSRSPH